MILLEGSGMRGNLKPKTYYISKTSFLLQANVRVASMDFLVILQNNYQNIVLKNQILLSSILRNKILFENLDIKNSFLILILYKDTHIIQ